MQLIRSLSILLLAFGHLQALWPELAPASLVVFVLCHVDCFQFYRRPPAVLWAAVGFIAYFFFLLVVHSVLRDYTLIEIFRTSGRLAYMVAIFVIACHLKPETEIERPLLRAAMAVMAVISLMSIYSCYVSTLTFGERTMSTDRALTGFFENHNTMAGTLGVILIAAGMTLVHQMQGYGPAMAGRMTMPLTGFLALSFALCLSRSFSLGLVLATAILGFQIPVRSVRRNFYLFGAVVAVGLAAFVVVNRSRQVDSDNISSRAILYRRAAGEFLKSPLIGIGPGAFQELQPTQNVVVPNLITLRRSGHDSEERTTLDVFGAGGGHVHNTYLQILCDFGMVGAGLLAFMAYQTYGARRTIRERLIDAEQPLPLAELGEWNGKVVLGSLLFLAISGVTVNWCFSSPPYTLLAYVAMGRLAAIRSALATADAPALAASNMRVALSN